ncbi:MAG TPA: cardiolipin synthase [Geobacteraceae bacterium]
MLIPMSRRPSPQHPRLTRIRRFFGRLRSVTDTFFTNNNEVTLYQHGGEFFPALLSALEAATRSIHLEFYTVRNDRVGQAVAERLLQSARSGVNVYLLYDYMGSFDTPGSFFRMLEQGGVHCVAFNPPPFRRGLAWFDKRDHRKIAVIDGQTAFAGGLNIADEYAGFGEDTKRWRDMGVRIQGPAVLELLKVFCENWQGETGDELPACAAMPAVGTKGNDDVMIVSGGPHHNRSRIRAAFRAAIAGAEESIRIENPYFVPGPRITRSLLRAARRGVQVQLILPAYSDVPLVRLVSRGFYAPLIRGGIQIYERKKTILHSKVMLIDDSWAVIGSANLDQRSFHRNYEVSVVVDSDAFGEQVAGMFAADLALSVPVSLAEHERRGWLVRLGERLCKPISWFL